MGNICENLSFTLQALVPSVLMNIYVVGLNQLFDVGIDKVIGKFSVQSTTICLNGLRRYIMFFLLLSYCCMYLGK